MSFYTNHSMTPATPTFAAPPRAAGTRRIVGGRVLALTLATCMATIAVPLTASALDAPAPTATSTVGAPIESFAPRTASAFESTLQSDIVLGEASMPTEFISNAAGTIGYATTHWDKTMYVLDLDTSTVTGTVAIPTNGAQNIVLSEDESEAYITLIDGYWSQKLAVIDLDALTVSRILPAPFGYIQETALAPGGDALYVLGLSGEVAKISLLDGAVQHQVHISGKNLHAMALNMDSTELIVTGEPGISVFQPDDLTPIRSSSVESFGDISDFHFDADPSRMYISDSKSPRLGVADPATGEVLASATVGPTMNDVIGDDGLDRAYGNVVDWEYVMSADLGTGERSESTRSTPHAPFSLEENPVTRDLLTSNGGWHGNNGGSTVSVIYRPGVTTPANATATTLGQEITLHTDITGIKNQPTRNSGVQWESSPDNGSTWETIEGETGNDLTVTVSADTPTTSYRVAWQDDFWGASGASDAASIQVPAPVITTETLPAGQVGTTYPATQLEATAQHDLSWNTGNPQERTVTGLPAGLTLNELGMLSGTPTEAGNFTVTVTATDAFGTDTLDYPLTITEQTGGNGKEPGTDKPGTDTPATDKPGTGTQTPGTGTTGSTGGGTSGTPTNQGGAQLVTTGSAGTTAGLLAGLAALLAGAGAILTTRRKRNQA